MFHNFKIRYDFNNHGYNHYVEVDKKLTEEELKLLGQMLASFPHCQSNSWSSKFEQLDLKMFSPKLLSIAANAYDGTKNTVLGVACDYADVKIVQKLIDMGAEINTPDQKWKKLALHWAICNRLSCHDKASREAVQLAAASIIEEHILKQRNRCAY